MSVNRSVQAAQRRRAVPQPTSSSSSNMQSRPSPQPSINSAHAFASQTKSGPGPKMPPGRLAAQQLSSNNQMMNDDQSVSSQGGLQGISKMTVAQAITLITLRLGKLETSFNQMVMDGFPSSSSSSYHMEGGDNENMVLVDRSVIESMTSRLESLEKRTTMPAGGRDLDLLKQQFEPLKLTVAQNKTAIGALIRDHKDMKSQVASMNVELTETKELAGALQNLVMDNSQKITDLHAVVGTNMDTDFNVSGYGEEEHLEELAGEHIEHQDEQYEETVDNGDNELVGTNLKELIEQELSGDT